MEKRYDRNIRIKHIGQSGQEKLLSSSVCIIGAGGLGSASIQYLAAAGIGRLAVIDHDRVDETNLQRQVIHNTDDIGREKTVSAAGKIRAINPGVRIETYNIKITDDNFEEITGSFDFVIDAVDNFRTKFVINDGCVRLGKPFCHAGALSLEAQVMTYVPGSPCLRCAMPTEPKTGEYPTSLDEGILGAVAGHAGTLQAIEAVKYITGIGRPLTGRMLFIDALGARYNVVVVQKRTGCC